jgi:hypothetical protein
MNTTFCESAAAFPQLSVRPLPTSQIANGRMRLASSVLERRRVRAIKLRKLVVLGGHLRQRFATAELRQALQR